MAGQEQPSDRLWSFPKGTVGPDASVKGFRVESSDGHAGKVAWASYTPGESYLVITLLHHLHKRHHVVPAAAVERVSTEIGRCGSTCHGPGSRKRRSSTIRRHRSNR